MAIFVDTFFVVALTNTQDHFHRKALELAEALNRQSLILTDAILLEIGNTLSSRFRAQAIQTIENFLDSDEVEVVRLDAELFERAFHLYKTHSDKSWGLVDCISFIVMQERGVTEALTHDRHFVQAGFTALMRESIN